jgi:hypothetical protein
MSGRADITVQFPSDEQWLSHRKWRHVFQTQMGRGVAWTDIERGEADLKLYDLVKLNGAPPLSQDEATFVMERVEFCEVKSLEMGADEAVVEMEIVNSLRVKHTFQVPTMGMVRRLTRATRILSLPFNRVEMKASLEMAARTWDECKGCAEGYIGPVPNIHKDVAIRAALQQIEDEAKPRSEEANF